MKLMMPPIDELEIANGWLETCITSQEQCNIDDVMLPPRLIGVATEPPRLVYTADWTERPRYATLSHCWSKYDFFKLIRENLDSLAAEIPMELLPKTFKDAIKMTRKLDLDYLWIDSPCIIQDETQDWEHESALMSYVYGGSSLNIAASSAVEANEGYSNLTPFREVYGLNFRLVVPAKFMTSDIHRFMTRR